MKINLWFKWFSSKQWYEKFFLILILLRPIAEPFFFLKKSSPLLSPLYWIGILTFLICIYGVGAKSNSKSNSNIFFNTWSLFVIINIVFLLASLDFFEFVIFAMKLVYPVLIFYFLKGFINSKYDLYGFMMVLLISSTIAGLWLIYDIITIGLNLRLGSSFADIVNYGIYANIALIIFVYFVLKSQIIKQVLWKPKIITSILLFSLILLGLFAIKHLASIGVFVAVVACYAFFLSRKNIGMFFIVIGMFFATFILVADKFMEDVVNERIEKEVQIAQGNRDQSQALHGRVSRWEWLFEDFGKAPLHSQLFGFPTSLKNSNHMIGVTPHNDFFRILFFTGIFGLIFYLSFLVSILSKIRFLATSEKFLVYAAVICFFLYSVSTVPTFYPGFNNFIFAIFAFVSLPFQKINELD